MTVWGPSSDFAPIYYEDTSKKAPVDEKPQKAPEQFIPPELNKKNVANVTLEAPIAPIPAKTFMPAELSKKVLAATKDESAIVTSQVAQGPPELMGSLVQVARHHIH